MAIRYLLKPGDAALVDDPGYYNMFGNLRLQGVEMLAVPRNPDGPDVAILEKLAAAHRPKVYFTQSVMQNPTGTDMSPHVAFKVLQAAERHNFTVVEDDIFCDLQVRTTPRLATLDQLNRVIYARSFSKTLSGSLRVGFLACTQDIANELADIKMLTSITTSQFTERLIYLMLVDGHYRKYLSRLHERLGEARLNVVRAFERIGLELFVEPADGMFLWARFPHIDDSLAAGGGVAARRHHACARRRLPSASRTLSVDAVQRYCLRRQARAGLAATGCVTHDMQCGSRRLAQQQLIGVEGPWRALESVPQSPLNRARRCRGGFRRNSPNTVRRHLPGLNGSTRSNWMAFAWPRGSKAGGRDY